MKKYCHRLITSVLIARNRFFSFFNILLLTILIACEQPSEEMNKIEVITYGPFYSNLEIQKKSPIFLGHIKVNAEFVVQVSNKSNKFLKLISF